MATDPADAASTAWIPALCSPLRSTLQFAERDLWNIASVRLDTGELHHLGPLFGFLCDQPAELRRRSQQRHAAEVGETGLHLGVGESRIDLFVELVDDLCGRVLGNALRACSWERQGRTTDSPRNPGRTRLSLGCPATVLRASRWSPRVRAACRP